MSDAILYEASDGIVTLTIDRPGQRNAISDPEVIASLLSALSRLDADPEARVAILTGAGTAFSSGGNVKKMGEAGGLSDPLPARTRLNYKRGIQAIPLAFERLEVPVIAAVNGPAVGAGCDLACLCDIRIASEAAWFAESFVQLGLIAGDGGAWLLPRAVGFSKACEMAFTGDRVDAREALACGLVSRVVPAEALMAEARALAARIASNPPHAVRMTKRLLWAGRSQRLDQHLETAAAMQALAHATADHREAVAAYLSKRPPAFTGS